MVRRIYARKRAGYAHEAARVFSELKRGLGLDSLESVDLYHRYDIEGLTDYEFEQASTLILSEPPVDLLLEELPFPGERDRILAVESLPGQFDQRADSAAQAVALLTHGTPPAVAAAAVWIFSGSLTDSEFEAVKTYLINPVESREASLALPLSLKPDFVPPPEIPSINGFTEAAAEELAALRSRYGLAMSEADLTLIRSYFAEVEERDPTETELKVLDTYWSDHCRHTTFLTRLNSVEFGDDPLSRQIAASYEEYLRLKERYSPAKPVSLMDLATIVMKQFRAEGRLDDLEVSEEINACSIRVEAEIDGKTEPWLVMFKNETHNHPTEIEPFGGAATCLGGAIRDPLSGRSWVYQAMRVTGSADPTEERGATLPGKLPQRTISTVAARGYSSYGNQIGIATGQVHEFFHPGYRAKHLEIGAVIGAAPEAAVVRQEPAPGDLILLIGGRTGRDGIGGATGSSKEHSTDSLADCGAEVQKGNPPTERKLQRLFRDSEVSHRIKRCNDFGAGGVAVAVGELAPGLTIDLDAVPRKYEGLDGTELAISESQERMAVVIDPADREFFIGRSAAENLEATVIAEVTAEERLVMRWRGEKIVDLARSFLDSNGAEQQAAARVTPPDPANAPFSLPAGGATGSDRWLALLGSLENCGQEGLGQIFDSTIGAGTLLMPFGGERQITPADGMAALLPAPGRQITTATLMSFGYDPWISAWSPYHGAVCAVLQSAARIAALGGDVRRIRLTFQEYFERLGSDPSRWGKPLAAMLGAFHAQRALGIPAIGGKDSMSGSFEQLDVPPTLVSFAVAPAEAGRIRSQELKAAGSSLVLLSVPRDKSLLPDLQLAGKIYRRLNELEPQAALLCSRAVGAGGAAAALAEISFGNGIGIRLAPGLDQEILFSRDYGSLIVEVAQGTEPEQLFPGLPVTILGQTIEEEILDCGAWSLPLAELLAAWRRPLEAVFPRSVEAESVCDYTPAPAVNQLKALPRPAQTGSPRVLIPVFPGTNCEYDSAATFSRAGGIPETLIIRNLTPGMIGESISAVSAALRQSQILMLPGGFSAGDEPEGSGKFIAAFFRNPELTNAVEELLERGGLILGICNGFQALIKLGLLPSGHITPLTADNPTLTYNTIGAHVSRFVTTRIETAGSPWLTHTRPGELHRIPVSHGEGRFAAPEAVIAELESAGQIAARYTDESGKIALSGPHNPNGSMGGVEALISPDGRILGKMGHSERCHPGLYRNLPGNKDQQLFRSGVEYFS